MRSARGWLVVATVALGLLAAGPAVAQAGVGFGVAPDIPTPNGPVTVGQTALASMLTITNTSTDGQAPLNVTLDTITIVPSCGSVAVSDCPAASAEPGVLALSSTGTGEAGTACAGTAFTIANVDAVQDKYELTPSTPVVLGPAGVGGLAATCDIDFTVSVLKVPTNDARPEAGVQTDEIGFASATASDSQPGSGSGTDFTTVNRASPTIVTTASPSTIAGSGSLSDSATVSGRANPLNGATVTFRLYGPNDASCAGAQILTSTVSYPVSDTSTTSFPFTPSSAGTYRWIASYSGDANNNAVTGACNDANESVVVTNPVPAIDTSASPDIGLGAGTLTDDATVSGRTNPLGAASVDFRLYGPDDDTCAGPPVFQSLGVSYPAAGGTVTSQPFTPTATGAYQWIATYSGDANNATVSGDCEDPDETAFVITLPTIATTASPRIALGAGTLSDSITVNGRDAPDDTATVGFELHGPNDPTCSAAPVFIPPELPYPVAGGAVTSRAFTPTQAGTYRWVAFYSGDINNLDVEGNCNDAGEAVVVAPAITTITTAASAPIALGAGALSDSATVRGRVSPAAAATVVFRLYAGADTACAGAPVFNATVPLSAAASASSPPFTPTLTGTYRWVASYGGDANNAAVASSCADPRQAVAVTATPPTILGATLSAHPRVGRSSVLTVRAIDRGVAIVGTKVQFGEDHGGTASSGCQVPALRGSAKAVRLRVPYTFRRSGLHEVKVSVLAGGCDGPQLTSVTKTIKVTVARGKVRAKTALTTRHGCRDATLTPAASAANRVRVAAAVFCLVNFQRRRYGRRNLIRSSLLASAAIGHSADMVRRRYFDHNVKGGVTFVQRLPRLGYRGVVRGENIDYGTFNDALGAVTDWMDSPPHRSNVLNARLKFAGVGAAYGIPISPRTPGATYTMDYGSTLR